MAGASWEWEPGPLTIFPAVVSYTSERNWLLHAQRSPQKMKPPPPPPAPPVHCRLRSPPTLTTRTQFIPREQPAGHAAPSQYRVSFAVVNAAVLMSVVIPWWCRLNLQAMIRQFCSVVFKHPSRLLFIDRGWKALGASYWDICWLTDSYCGVICMSCLILIRR